MSREKQPNQRKASRAHHERTDQLVERIIDQLSIGATEEAMRLISLVDLSRVDEFRFRDFPTFKRLVEEMKRSYAQRLRLGLISAQKSEWDESWAMQDLLVSKALRSYGINGKQGGKIGISLSEQRDSALRSFLKRREQGMNLSERVWDLSGEHQTLLERSIATALKHGSSFAQLSREVLRYLRDYPRLESAYRQAFGKKLDIGNIRYQAQRLARTEINMAYRSAESSRWQELDFVVGYEVKRSQRNERRKVKDPKTGRTKTVVINSDCPVCDALKGRYPKDFKWTAWHPNCRCYAVPILSSREDFLRGEDPKKSANAVTELPQGFKDWVKDNEGRIATASHRGTLPYFLRDNQGKWQSLVGATAQTQAKTPLTQKTELANVIEVLSKSKIEYNEVKILDKPLNERDIISRVGGGDLTKGSCSSLAFAYAGNKAGLDVLDFRDGNSRESFSTRTIIMDVAEKVGGRIVKEISDYNASKELFNDIKEGKEYYFACAAHAAIVRKTSTGFEYLELQSATSNGFKPLDNAVLKRRFGAKKSRSRYRSKFAISSCLIDLDLLHGDAGFREMLGYINTNKNEQRKGVDGAIK